MRQFHPRKGKAIGIYGRLLESPFRPEIAAEIGVAYLVAAMCKFTAEIGLERMSCIVVYQNLQDALIVPDEKRHRQNIANTTLIRMSFGTNFLYLSSLPLTCNLLNATPISERLGAHLLEGRARILDIRR